MGNSPNCDTCERSETKHKLKIEEVFVSYKIGNEVYTGKKQLCVQCAMMDIKYLSINFPEVMTQGRVSRRAVIDSESDSVEEEV